MRRYVLAALAPTAPWALVLLERMSAGADAFSRDAYRAMAVDALLWTAALVVVGGPLVGIAAAHAQRGTRDTPRRLPWLAQGAVRMLACGLLFTGVSAGLMTLAWGTGADTVRAIAAGQATLLCAALAVTALGAMAGSWFREPLDAVIASVVVVGPPALGVLLFGPLLEGAAAGTLTGALMASPVAAAATAADIDIFRMDPLYQLSPVAHMSATYPDWQSVCQLYLLVALFACGGILIRARVTAPVHPQLKGSAQ